MIDLHTHIIPEVDDGSSSLEESLEMLKIAEADGITKMVATPHTFSFASKVDKPLRLKAAFSKLKKEIEKSDISIEIFMGSENYLVSGLRENIKKCRKILTINNSDYFLLEFPMNFIYPGTKEFIFDILNDGFIPVICHPERNTVIQEDISILYDLLVAGALCQVDAGSLNGSFGTLPGETADKLLKFNLVHTIASDCHNTGTRPPGLSFLYKELKWVEEEKIDLFLKDIPESIINNIGIPDIGPLKDPKASKSIFSIFRRGE
ncbi:MAG: CpsB/CapC family capsule biosynthesis tyrosine phosphatase [Acidobacteriota bacterium]